MLRSPIRSVVRPTVRALVRSPLEAGRRRAGIIARLLSAGALRYHHSVDAALRRNLTAGVWGQSSGWTAGQLAQCAAFQDAAGTTPVWAHEQPLGLLLDTSRGLVRGPELAAAAMNGPPWAAQGGLSSATANSFTTSSAGGLLLAAPAGRAYDIDFAFTKSDAVTEIGVRFGISGTLVSSTAASGVLRLRSVSGADGIYLRLGGAATLTLTARSVREIPGVHLSQPTNTVSRPLVRWADTSAPACARFDGFDDWLQHAALDLTNTDEVTVVGGLRKASDAATGCFYEQSASSSSGSGKIAVFAPIANGQPAVTFRSRGSLSSDATATGIPAPVNLVFAGEGSRGGDLARLRINGTVSAEVTSDQGGTGYGNEVGFVGRRNGASQPFNGDFYGLSLCDRLLSASDLAELERLHGRLTGSMP
jgi:hypothetical protein